MLLIAFSVCHLSVSALFRKVSLNFSTWYCLAIWQSDLACVWSCPQQQFRIPGAGVRWEYTLNLSDKQFYQNPADFNFM